MSAIQRIATRATELGAGLTVRRALPTRQRRSVGAWCFLDHIGPIDFAPDAGLHVGAHPHIGLQTFTWPVAGEILHRDSLGNEQRIRPGQVNLMTAGHGIAHTEDSPQPGQRLHAAQLWIALPPEQRDCPPDFVHYPELPSWRADGAEFTLLAGDYLGKRAPTRIHTPLLGLDIAASADVTVDLPLRPEFEYGLLPLIGRIVAAGESLGDDEFLYLEPGHDRLQLKLPAGGKLLLLGGEPFAAPIQMWWNFVAGDRASIA
ncbi:pirin family protein [Azonexus sp. R2A61]|uniref:pirin family protein n=1 Tax=Azonexus sp. R2A61 TaxID=2744443 RepID=UPI001F42A0FA|nr:pirin family protein [Azonexus sp. R2A61]